MAALSPVRIDWSRAIEASYVPAKIVNGFDGPEFVDDEITDGDDAVPRAVMQDFLAQLAQEVAGRTWTKEDGGEGVTVYDKVPQKCTRYTSERQDRMELWRGEEKARAV